MSLQPVIFSSSPSIPDYEMGYCAPLDLHRVEKFFDGKLTCQELVLFAQDVIEAQQVFSLGPRVYRLAHSFVEQRICTVTGSYLQ